MTDIGGQLADIVEAAAEVILPYWRTTLNVRRKDDDSPVTEADQAAEAVILHALKRRWPDIPVVAEEDAALYGTPAEIGPRFFLVDPLDGTKAFVRGDEFFTVNIALVEDRRPVAGAVAAPVRRTTWFTTGAGAFRRTFGRTAEPIAVRPAPPEGSRALVSHTLRPEAEAELRGRYGFVFAERMDSSIKLCLIAEGAADLYPRHGPTCEWDIAAGHAVLAAAGGTVTTPDGRPLLYGKVAERFVNGWFVARGGQTFSGSGWNRPDPDKRVCFRHSEHATRRNRHPLAAVVWRIRSSQDEGAGVGANYGFRALASAPAARDAKAD